ncbi:hypothetical protein [Xenorhabdus miraniensis]|uniref:Uncharacterized protein n=1 Tax=Xenorhabdus miraniensis TaxID=351674 RepID=A0A2D0JJT5_9GAMM|nr:hypothetical protein [Xenorhabdus miraniensis]PHM46558.1 hypothetical protein Xmir_04123 [Xenorhabdus miraniensis]
MRNNVHDAMAVVPTQPQAIRNRRAWKRRIALLIISTIVFIPV